MTSVAEISNFLIDLSCFFPFSSKSDRDRLVEQYSSYLFGKIGTRQIDFKKLLTWIVDNRNGEKEKYFPDIGFIRDNLYRAEIRPAGSAERGKLYSVFVKTPVQIYEWVLEGYTGDNNAVRACCYKKHGENHEILGIYPTGTARLVGDEVIVEEG